MAARGLPQLTDEQVMALRGNAAEHYWMLDESVVDAYKPAECQLCALIASVLASEGPDEGEN